MEKIIAVRKDKFDNITHVKFESDKIKTKESVVKMISDENELIFTAYKENGSNYKTGSQVIVYTDKNNNKQIRTNSNKDDKDNLDNLPLF